MSVTREGFRFWHAVEPDARSLTIDEGARARLADPLFMLARQWRAGEFRHVEGGVPVAVDLGLHAAVPAGFRDAAGTLEALDGSERADEIMAEPPARPGDGPRALLALARQIADLVAERIARAEGPERKALDAAWSELRDGLVSGDDDDARLLRLRAAAGDPDAFDARRLRRAVERGDAAVTGSPLWPVLRDWTIATGGAPAPDPLTEIEDDRPTLPERFRDLIPDRSEGIFERPDVTGRFRRRAFVPADRLRDALDDFLTRDRVPDPPAAPPPPEADAFDPARLDHHGDLTLRNADGGTYQLSIWAGDREGPLAWHGFGAPDTSEEPFGGYEPATLVPSRLSFAGKPPERLWSLDDRAADWTRASAGPADLTRALATDALLAQSSDWFVVPLRARRNARLRVRDVILRTGFRRGGSRPEAARNDAELTLWVAAGEGPADRLNAFAERAPLLGPPVEEAVLAPDDAANLLWLIERVLPDLWGRGAEMDASVPPSPQPDAPLYELQRPPPSHWYPFALTAAGQFEARALLRLGRGRETPRGRLGGAIDTLPRGRVPMKGLSVTRRWAMGRDLDGRPVLWVARDVAPARETGGSGVAWDRLTLPSER